MERITQFSTQTDQRWYAACTALIAAGMGIFGGSIMWLWFHMIGPALLVSGTALLLSLFVFLLLFRQHSIRLHFYGRKLQIFHTDGLVYTFDSVPLRAFKFRQNALERKCNVGRIKIKGSQFYLHGVQNYTDTCRYIQQNFPD